MNTKTEHGAEQIAKNINKLAEAIYSEYELYTEKGIAVDSDHFNHLEELMTIVSSIGNYLATAHEDEADVIASYTEMFQERTNFEVKIDRERKAHAAAEVAARKAYDATLAAALNEERSN